MPTQPTSDHVTIIIAGVLFLSQLGVIAWVKWSFESMAEKIARKLIEDHEEDDNAHARSAAVLDLKIELKTQRQLLEQVLIGLTELRSGCILAKQFLHKEGAL